MTRRPRRARNLPRIKIRDKDGRASLAGMNYTDLRWIMDCAAIHAHDCLADAQKEKNAEGIAEYTRLLKVLTLIGERTSEAIHATYPKYKPTIADRWRNVKQERRDREVIDSIMREYFPAYKEN